MKKRMLTIFAVLCLVLCLAPMAALADTTQIITVNVGGANTANDDYKIEDASIKLLKRDVTYELTGETDKKISIWGSNNAEDIDQAHYIRLNNAKLNGGIVVENSPVKMVLDVPEGTDNYVKRLSAVDLTIKGKGTLRAESLVVIQRSAYMSSALQITDTAVIVTTPASAGDSSQWNGICVLSGDAVVKYIGNGKYPALKVGVKYGDTHSLTLKDNAKLYCLQDDMNVISHSAVDGITISSTLTLEGNSYLEAEGKPTDGNYKGSAVLCEGDITVRDNATIKATAQGSAICGYVNVFVEGGNIIAESTGGNGVYAGDTLKITDGAHVDATGLYPGLYAYNAVTIENSVVKSLPTGNYYGIYSDGTYAVSGSYIETVAPRNFEDDTANSVVFDGNEGTVVGNAVLPDDVTIAADKTLLIPENTSLTVGEGKTLTNNGTVTIKGSFAKANGTVICNSHSGGTATCTAKAICALCAAEYGDLDAENHTGEAVWTQTATTHVKKYTCCGAVAVEEAAHTFENGVCTVCAYACLHEGGSATCKDKATCTLCGESYGELQPGTHADLTAVAAKAATTEAEGNIAYWYCSGCDKYYSDAAATKEIEKAQTVIAKLTAAPDNGGNNGGNNTGNGNAATGDTVNYVLLLVVLLISGGAVVSVLILGRKKKTRG